MKKIIVLILALSMLTLLSSCKETEKKVLTCDGCGAPVEVKASSKLEEESEVYCADCIEVFGLDTIYE